MTTQAVLMELQSADRDATLNPRQLRATGWLPGTLYGTGLEKSVSVQIHNRDFLRKYHSDKHRKFSLTGVTGSPSVRVKQIQVHNVTQAILNIEFMVLSV
jgi:ribosomal protein L25 (general stress protein Ctc)